jgi:predicted metalloprotease with PDZ domain
MIDLEIRRNTFGSNSLDDVIRRVYFESYVKESRGFTDEEFEKACNGVCGKSLSEEIFGKRVKGRSPIDFSKYLGYAGLVLKPKSEKESAKGFLGAKLRQDNGRTIVTTTLFDTPIENSGIAVGDEIIAVDDLRMDAQKVSFYIGNRQAGTPLRFLLSRNGSILEAKATLGKRPYFEYRIFKRESATFDEKALFQSWLGANWDKEELKYEEYAPSPVKKPALDYV